jgi:hypothetical protein
MIIVYWLAESPKRFAALRREMPDISQKVLTEQLRELISDGIVQRQPRGAIPAPVEYSLLSPCVFRMRRAVSKKKWERMKSVAEPRSAYLLSGRARTEWEHSIAQVGALRYSITFGNVRED